MTTYLGKLMSGSRKKREISNAIREMNKLDDDTLEDLGISRFEIRRVVENAYEK